jgi:hypothetical protein
MSHMSKVETCPLRLLRWCLVNYKMFGSLFVRHRLLHMTLLSFGNRWYLMFFNIIHVWLSHDGAFDETVVDEQPASQAGVNSFKDTCDKFSASS